METLLERFTSPAIFVPFCIFALPVIIWGVKCAFQANATARVVEAELALKRELVSQGRSAEEIERIMKSQTSHGKMDA